MILIYSLTIEAKTEQGRLGLRFADDSKVKLTEHSTLIIDEYIYDPNPTKSKLALSFAKGTARFVTAKFSSISKRKYDYSYGLSYGSD